MLRPLQFRGGSLTLYSVERGAPRSPFSLRENEGPCLRPGRGSGLTWTGWAATAVLPG